MLFSLVVTFVAVVTVAAAFSPEWVRRMSLAIVHLLTMLYRVKVQSFKYTGKYYCFVDTFEDRVDANPNHIQFISIDEDREVTLAEVDHTANRFAHWSLKLGLKPK